jgi:tRNA A-37 threonylcarbamoyl transferase component Bud32
MKTLIGKRLGQYEIREKIGQGGMAHVYKAYQPGLDRFVAIKVLSPTLADESGFTERFQREARSVARLHHPNILEVYDFGVQDGFNYIAMRYVENSTTLGDLIQKEAPLQRLIDYILQVADALNYAHERGVIHRDVKPSNILIDGRWALLADFGLAKIAATSSTLTGTGVGIGTPAYMSPEQASGSSDVDHRTDIYALGIILHRVLTGSVPHESPTPLAILIKRSTEPVHSMREIKPDIPESLDQVVLRSLAMQPDERYSSATDLAEAISRARGTYIKPDSGTILSPVEGRTEMVDKAAGGATVATPSGATQAGAPTADRGPNLALIAGGAVAGLLVVGVLFLLMLSFVFKIGPFAGSPGDQVGTPVTAEAPGNTPENEVVLVPTDTPTPMPPGAPAAIAQADLEVRGGPGDEYDLLGYLPEGAQAEIAGRDDAGQWWQIKTSLEAAGLGWIKAGSDFSEASNTEDLPIALAPPTPTPLPVPDTPTATSTSVPDTATPTATQVPDTQTPTAVPPSPTPPATPTAPQPAAPTRTPTLPAGQFVLLKPVPPDNATAGPTEFEWQWTSPLGAGQGFEVRVWREGEPPAGVHNAVEDNQNGNVAALGNNTYRLNVDITDAYGVLGRGGDYLWTVALVQVSPDYQDLGKQASPGSLRLDIGGGGGDGGGGPVQPGD